MEYAFTYMRLRKAPYTEFRRIATTLDTFSSVDSDPVFMINNIPVMDIELVENDLMSLMNPACPQCSSSRVSRNGTCIRKMENGTIFRVQRYICKSCRYSFVARPPNYGYGKHHPDDIRNKSVKARVKTSLRKTAHLFRIIGSVIISHETIRRNVPDIQVKLMASSGYFVYDEQYVSLDGMERFRALLKDVKKGNFTEEILDDLKENTLISFFVSALQRFMIHGTVTITTDGYHYEYALKEAGRILGLQIRRQRCLFHIEKDLSHKIKLAEKEDELDGAKRLIKFMFFQTPENLRKIKNHEALSEKIEGKSEPEIVEYILDLLNGLYADEPIIQNFLDFVKKNRKEVFLYLKDGEVEKTSNIAEQHFSIMSWLFKNRFKTKEGLLRTSYWYHHYLSTGM